MKKYNITVNGTTYEVVVEEVTGSSNSHSAYTPPVTHAPQKSLPTKPRSDASVGGNNVCSPMPGTILDVKVSSGQSVKKGDVICVLEAMKMENDIPAPCDGVVASINVQKGASVAAGDVIAIIN